ncbi:ABC transporter permease [Fodinicola feengrottensis]|uniref:ABC transporter permease n=1 Tax=Fodinicola feengrottensis TaxID=435914 RepID=A0ABP4UEG7_9ACTN|nr:ABC-2 family transporter protein [Fodinicola feengrottensis]
MNTVAVYAKLIGAQIRSQTSYRRSFVIDMISQAAVTVFEVVAIVVLFNVTHSLGGFSFKQTILISGLALTGFRIGDLVAGGLNSLSSYVRLGQLDALLVRPLSSLGQLIVNTLEVKVIGSLLQAAVVLAIALRINDISWTPLKVVVLIGSIASAGVSISAVFVAGSSLTFWFIDAQQVSNAFTFGGRDFTSYPITVYGSAFRVVFAYVVPFAFVAYYPVLTLLDRPDPLGMPSWFGYCSPLAAAVLATAAALLWRTGIRHYRGTGS